MKKTILVLMLCATVASGAEPPQRPSKFGPEPFRGLFARLYVKQLSPGVWEYTIHNWSKCPVTLLTLYRLMAGVKGESPSNSNWQIVDGLDSLGKPLLVNRAVTDERDQIDFLDFHGSGVLPGQSVGGFRLSGGQPGSERIYYMLQSTCFDSQGQPVEGGDLFLDIIPGPGLAPPPPPASIRDPIK
jgi:hypothetical protein